MANPKFPNAWPTSGCNFKSTTPVCESEIRITLEQRTARIADSKPHWRDIESGVVSDLKFLNADAAKMAGTSNPPHQCGESEIRITLEQRTARISRHLEAARRRGYLTGN